MPVRIPENELGNTGIGIGVLLLIVAIITGHWEGWWLIVVCFVSGFGLNYLRNRRR
jgi:hypothetical protein